MNRIAIITSDVQPYPYDKKICGLYPLERTIFILATAGFREIYLRLSDREYNFYRKKIKSHLGRIRNSRIIDMQGESTPGALVIPSNLFMQARYMHDFEKYFIEKEDAAIPAIRDDQFLLRNDSDFKRGEALAKETIIRNTGGVIAKKVNKRISIPISLILARTRIHPNYLTVFNMGIGFLSALFLIQNTYWYIVLGGFFFQLASVFDGVDGEVAKFTFTVSKIGGWLDTISDNGTLFLFLAASSYLYFLNFTGYLAIAVIACLFIGLVTLLIAMITYLKKYSDSGSLVAYDREFLQKLPPEDPLVALVNRLKYITKKEFFALFLFLFSFTGRIDLIIPLIAVILVAGALTLQIINLRYLKEFPSLSGESERM